MFSSLNICVQPTREERGVPIWCALSLAIPAQSLFCSLALLDL